MVIDGYNNYSLKLVFNKINDGVRIFTCTYFVVISEQIFILPGPDTNPV